MCKGYCIELESKNENLLIFNEKDKNVSGAGVRCFELFEFKN